MNTFNDYPSGFRVYKKLSKQKIPCGVTKMKSNKSSAFKAYSSIFESFNKLTSDDEKIRIKGASGLIKSLEETSAEEVSQKFVRKCAPLKKYF